MNDRETRDHATYGGKRGGQEKGEHRVEGASSPSPPLPGRWRVTEAKGEIGRGWVEKSKGERKIEREGTETVRNGREKERIRGEPGEKKGTGIEREREPAGSMPFGRFGESRIASFLLPGLCFPPSRPTLRTAPRSAAPHRSPRFASRATVILSPSPSHAPLPPELPADPFCLTFVRPTDRPFDRHPQG